MRGIWRRLCPDRGIVDLYEDRRQPQRRGRRVALSVSENEGRLQLDIIIPVLMSCALLWWVGRAMTWTARLTVAVVTLVLIACVLLFERTGR